MKMSNNKPIEHLEHWRWEQREEERDRTEAKVEYEREKLKEQQKECPHDEHDHYICLDCGKDLLETMIERADLLRDE